MDLAIFSIFDNFVNGNIVLYEFLDKHLKLLDKVHDKYDNIYFYKFNHDIEKNEIIQKYLDKYNNFSVLEVKGPASLKTKDITYFSFGNFIDFDFNHKYYTTGEIDGTLLNHFTSKYINVYYKINNFFRNNPEIPLYQYFSDPVDLVFDNARKLTPDSLNMPNMIYFPLYQFNHSEVETMGYEKEYDFIVGSTCYDSRRTSEFNKFILRLFEKHENNKRFKFYVSGYKNYFYNIDNFVAHEEFFKELSKSKYGLVLKTYSQDVISANKISQYLNAGVVPLIAEDADIRSKFIPKDLRDKYTVRNSEDIELIINSYRYEDALEDWKSFKEFLFHDFDFYSILTSHNT